MKLSHNELANNLAVHLMSDDRMVWEDIPAGPSGSIRPDVYTIQKSFAHPNPMSYEVKVSVSDFRSDVTKAKWKGYLDFSYGVIFAVPKGLITKKDIPNGCGLMTFNGEFWNTVKRPTLHPAKLNDELLIKLLIEGNQRQTQKQQIVARDYDTYRNNAALRKKWGEDISEKLHFIDKYPEMRKELYQGVKNLSELLGVEVPIMSELFKGSWRTNNLFWSLNKRIEEIAIQSDESERKAQISKELVSVQRDLDRSIERIIQKYVG